MITYRTNYVYKWFLKFQVHRAHVPQEGESLSRAAEREASSLFGEGEQRIPIVVNTLYCKYMIFEL